MEVLLVFLKVTVLAFVSRDWGIPENALWKWMSWLVFEPGTS